MSLFSCSFNELGQTVREHMDTSFLFATSTIRALIWVGEINISSLFVQIGTCFLLWILFLELSSPYALHKKSLYTCLKGRPAVSMEQGKWKFAVPSRRDGLELSCRRRSWEKSEHQITQRRVGAGGVSSPAPEQLLLPGTFKFLPQEKQHIFLFRALA